YYYNLVFRTILNHQDSITGLIPSREHQDHAYIRDNTYAAMSVWALTLAYKKTAEVDEDRARLRDLEGRVTTCMRSLLVCMMRQADKLERFKASRQPADALHCKFSAAHLDSVTGDSNYGHLQLDAVALYLLALAQITASGLVLIYTQEEAAFVQNLVLYIDSAYTVCDYGIWERGDKTNHGLPELNSTSVGMAKAALEAMSELDLFGSSGGPRAFVHVMADDSQNCAAVLEHMLPRESCSKETDAGLLSVIGYPAFAVDNEDTIVATRDYIVAKLEGRYGCCRFLRDGYRTAREDASRLHYEPWELKQFENIECEWPLFFCYLLLDAYFRDDANLAAVYSARLEKLVLRNAEGLPVLPESFAVPAAAVAAEVTNPGSQDRQPVGALPHLWSQSLYIVCKLIGDGCLRPQEIDPIGRRLCTEAKPDLVVQVVIVAEDNSIKQTLETHLGLRCVQDFSDVQRDTGIWLLPAKLLGHFYGHLGRCHQLGLSGRATNDVGILATSRLYVVGDQTLAFTPQFFDLHSFYLSLDFEFLLDQFRTNVAYLRRTWSAVGRPLFIVPVYNWYFNIGDELQLLQPAFFAMVKKLQSGYINGTRVTLGRLSDFLDTSCVTNMSFLDPKKADELLGKARATTSTLHCIGRIRPTSSVFDTSTSTAMASVAAAAAATQAARQQEQFAAWKRQKSCVLSSAVSAEMHGLPLNEKKEIESGSVEQQLEDESLSPFYLWNSEEDDAPAYRKLRQPMSLESSSGSSLSSMVIGASDQSAAGGRAFNHRTLEKRRNSCASLAEIGEDSLLARLEQSELLYEQFDIVYHLYTSRGPSYDTGWRDKNGAPTTVRDLVKELYEHAGSLKQWWLVRYTAGMLDKRVETLPICLTDLLVRQKQVTIGLPPEPEDCVLTSPKSSAVLADLIKSACGNDITLGMLTQEILVYLSMLAKTERTKLRNICLA
ncbi:hypothetical protein BOX15_Mlig016019g1, partial [Macrostomum lignano]